MYLPAYYGNNPKVEFNNVWKTATLFCNGSGTGVYWRLLLYGDDTLIATAYCTQSAVTVDVSSYQKLRIGGPENGNTFSGWIELS